MNPLTLAEVRKHTGRQLTYAEAITLANPGGPFLRNMAVALSLHTWNNTARHWLRLEAALVILHHKPPSPVNAMIALVCARGGNMPAACSQSPLIGRGVKRSPD